MRGIPISRRHILLISLQSAAHAIRSGTGLVFFLLSLLFGLGVAQAVFLPVEMAKNPAALGQPNRPGMATEDAVSVILEQSGPIVAWALGGKGRRKATGNQAGFSDNSSVAPPDTAAAAREAAIERWSDYLLRERPGLLSGIFLLLLFGVPRLVPLVAFNQISGDVQSKGLRYLLLRTERANIFFGRFIGTTVFAIAVIAVLIATITLYLGLKIRIYEAGPLALWGLHGFAALAILMLPYVALCSWFSATITSPFLSLIASSAVISGVPLFAWMMSWRWKPAGELQYLLPWAWQNHLLHNDWTHVALAAIGCVTYTAVFLAIGYWQFERRDL
jgi:hypothetical protein